MNDQNLSHEKKGSGKKGRKPESELARENGAREIVRKKGVSGVKETQEICQKTEEPIVMNSRRGSRWRLSKALRR